MKNNTPQNDVAREAKTKNQIGKGPPTEPPIIATGFYDARPSMPWERFIEYRFMRVS